MSPIDAKTSKGEETRAAILDAAIQQAGAEGFEALTIGSLASRIGMSKSGLFAHFGSKEELQVAALDEAARRFTESAFGPAMSKPRGLQRLTAVFENWLDWTTRAGLRGCPMMSASSEFDGRPGVMRDAIAGHMQRLNQAVIRNVQMAVESGELKPTIDAEQFAFELFGVIASFYRSRNLFQDDKAHQRALAAFSQLLAPHRVAPATPAPTSAPSDQTAATGD